MSGSVTSGGTQPASGHSEGGGGGGPPHPNVVGGTPAGITNQTVLALDPSVHANLPPEHRHALKKIQLEFARDVSARAAKAYQQTLDTLSRPENPPQSAG